MKTKIEPDDIVYCKVVCDDLITIMRTRSGEWKWRTHSWIGLIMYFAEKYDKGSIIIHNCKAVFSISTTIGRKLEIELQKSEKSYNS